MQNIIMEKNAKIYVAGHRGLVGSAIVRALKSQGCTNLISKTREELNLLDSLMVHDFLEKEKPKYIFLAAGKVGGILANDTYSADFIYENILIEANIIHAAYMHKVEKLLFLGSSCIYPRDCPQPIKEEYLLTGELEKTNEAYAIAKIAGIKMCQAYNKQYGTNFISIMPTNLYGPNDNFNLNSSHVLPALVRKFHDAKMADAPEVAIWGSGIPRREFLHVDDLASACIHLMEKYDGNEIINIGTGEDISIQALAFLVKDVTGYNGRIINDMTKPDGTMRKILDVSKLHDTGWKHKISLKEGIKTTYQWFLENNTNRTTL